jgi:penicillin amidase
MRFIINMSDPSSAGFILASGQSGHPWSPHYSDQSRLWLRGKTIKIFSEDRGAGSESSDLSLEPVPSL